ncbi:MAG: MFS transporter [bacterium]|nr:MFS transporter [bacterium]
MSLIKHHLHYFSYRLSREVEEVYWHTLLNNLALSMVFIFEPIFLYTRGYSLVQIMWFYVQVYVWYVILIGFGAKFAGKYGYKHAIFVSNIFYIIYWLILFSVDKNTALFFIAPIFFALQKSWFWPAYDADIALSTAKVQEGREVGVLLSLVQAGFVAGPFLGGLLAHKFGFSALFVCASLLLLFSVYPLFRSPDIHSRHKFRYKNLWDIMKALPQNFFGYFGYAEDLMVMSLWPIYIFLILPNVFGVGLMTTVATALGTVLMLYIGKLTDKIDKRKLIQLTSLFYAVTWLFRFLAKSVPSVLAIDSAHKTGKDISSVPILALTFERAGSRGPDYAIAYSVFYEFSLAVGKIVTALLVIWMLTAGLSIYLVFAVVGLMTLMYGLLK